MNIGIGLDLNLDDYSYHLPENLIAQHASIPRDSCKLMILGNGKENNIIHAKFSDILGHLQKGDVLVMNSTRVRKAKLVGKKESGSHAEIVLEKKIDNDLWECRIKCKNPDVGTRFVFEDGAAVIVSKTAIDKFIIRMNPEVLSCAILPTPPYIKRSLSGKEYQTVFSREDGSLAAPTAGLHFTRRLLEKIRSKGVGIVFITLHVSYGTFKTIDAGVKNHVMDPEFYCISKDAADTINSRKGRLIVVGTTTLKALESSSKNKKIFDGSGESRLFIYPPFMFNSGADCLVTNFHLPKSTLLLLTSAFAGSTNSISFGRDRIMHAYFAAIKKKYRFYSLGDAMMIWM
jgi:S-adenosylmethionine:tRNA ribosyltransferase-isomerase